MKIILVLIAAVLLSLNASADDNKEHKTTQKIVSILSIPDMA